MNGGIFGQNFSLKVLPVWAILSIDVLVVFVSSLLAYALRYDFRSIFLDSSSIDKTILWVVIVNLVFFRVFRTYSNCTALFLFRGYHACFRIIDGGVCTADVGKCPDGERLWFLSGSAQCAVHVLCHQFRHDGMFPHHCQDSF